MSLPTWEGFMVPCLRALSDGSTRSRREMNAVVADLVGLDADDRALVIGSGQPQFANRIGWALSQLARVGALAKPSRGHYRITDAGREVLAGFPEGVTEKQLDTLGEDPTSSIQPYVASTRQRPPLAVVGAETTAMDPTEQVEQGISRIHADVAVELLARLCAQDPSFFESAVVRLLLAMGYGGVGGRGLTTSRSNDGGIDGVIDQDVLGLSKVYVQAKRYAPGNSVQRPELQGFVGALSGKADSGVFFTTSTFSAGAVEWADRVPARVILVDGQQLATLMIRYKVGVQVKDTYAIVEVDEDFFA